MLKPENKTLLKCSNALSTIFDNDLRDFLKEREEKIRRGTYVKEKHAQYNKLEVD